MKRRNKLQIGGWVSLEIDSTEVGPFQIRDIITAENSSAEDLLGLDFYGVILFISANACKKKKRFKPELSLSSMGAREISAQSLPVNKKIKKEAQNEC